jgi:hypothetical protein
LSRKLEEVGEFARLFGLFSGFFALSFVLFTCLRVQMCGDHIMNASWPTLEELGTVRADHLPLGIER